MSTSLLKAVQRDFTLLNWPIQTKPEEILDVAIIGGGQCGLGLSLALRKYNITNVQIFDRARAGEEGPWATTARMLTLRSPKEFPGPALELPSLTFRAWYEDKNGEWEKLGKIPTLEWMSYLRWLLKALNVSIKNEWHLQSIHPGLTLSFDKNRSVQARTVVLATGRDGFGGFSIPPFIANLPRSSWFHTGERIDPKVFKGKKIIVVGDAASAFDIAATALEHEAEKVTMLSRREKLSDRNPWAEFKGWAAYASMSDQEKIENLETKCKLGTVVPPESVARVTKWKNFTLLLKTTITAAHPDRVETNHGPIPTDLILLGTGYAIDLFRIPELASICDQILLWGDLYPKASPKVAPYPYLGSHFEFLEKKKGTTPHLKHIYCFNYGAFLSQGRIAGDTDVIPIGLNRLAEGIAIDLFKTSRPTRRS